MTLLEKLERLCIIGAQPVYTPFGYVITDDGLIYSLTVQHTHGVIMALLYPDQALAQGYAEPDMDDYNVFHYQRFELDNHKDFPVVRIAMGMMYNFNISKGSGPATQLQIGAVSKILRTQDITLNDTVQTDCRETSARDMLKWLETDEST